MYLDNPIQRTFVSSDGHKITYRDVGGYSPFNGRPVVPIIFFHGNLNSSQYMPAFQNTSIICHKNGVRWITPDRPGVGGSTMRSYDIGYMEIVDEITQFIRRVVGRGRVALVGYSSGGPYALATAVKLGSRVTSLTLVSSDVEYYKCGHPVFDDIKENPISVENALELSEKNCERLLDQYRSVKNLTKRALCMADLGEAIAQGYEGVSRDVYREMRPWGFDPSQVSELTHVIIYHGRADKVVPIKYGEYLKNIFKGRENFEFHFLEGETHSLIRRHFERIVKDTTEVYFHERFFRAGL